MQKDVLPSLPKPPGAFRVLCLGDVVGKSGVAVVRRKCPVLREELQIDFVIANGENAAGGVGFDGESLRQLKSSGVDIVTLGDHVWSRKEVEALFKSHSGNALQCIRPANYPPDTPGEGGLVVESRAGVRVLVMNLLGRTFSPYFLDCPFRKADELLAEQGSCASVRILDFHSEATSEKIAMMRYLDGRVSLICGTHTHVQTADEQVLDKGTGCITDLGMCGVSEGVIGMDADVAIRRFMSGMPHSYKCAGGRSRLSGAVADIDPELGSTVQIERINIEVRI